MDAKDHAEQLKRIGEETQSIVKASNNVGWLSGLNIIGFVIELVVLIAAIIIASTGAGLALAIILATLDAIVFLIHILSKLGEWELEADTKERLKRLREELERKQKDLLKQKEAAGSQKGG